MKSHIGRPNIDESPRVPQGSHGAKPAEVSGLDLDMNHTVLACVPAIQMASLLSLSLGLAMPWIARAFAPPTRAVVPMPVGGSRRWSTTLAATEGDKLFSQRPLEVSASGVIAQRIVPVTLLVSTTASRLR
jgi:hypothetical protein